MGARGAIPVARVGSTGPAAGVRPRAGTVSSSPARRARQYGASPRWSANGYEFALARPPLSIFM